MDLGKMALLGGAAYVGYKIFFQPATAGGAPASSPLSPASPAPSYTPGSSYSAPPAQAPPSYQAPAQAPYSLPPVLPPVVPGPAPVAFNSLDSIYQRLAAAAGAGPLTADQFNWYLAQQLPSGVAAPDPLLVFNTSGTWDRTVPMTLANYWGGMAPYLRSNLGLAGLGVYGGLGSLVRRYW